MIYKSINTRSQNRPLCLGALLLSVIAHFGGVYILAKGEPAGKWGGTYRPNDVTAAIFYLMPLNRDMVSPSIASNLKNMTGLINPSESEKIGNSDGAEVSITSPSSSDGMEVQKSPAVLTLPTEPYYFLAKELTQTPVVVLDVPAQLTLTAADVSVGAAILRMLISEYGDVDRVFVEDSVLSEEGRNILVAAFLKTKFQAGEIDGMPVKSELKIEVMLE